MKIFGSTSSPYVRRVRVVAIEVDEPIDLVDTTSEAGMAALHEVSPIGKVPTAIIDGRTIYDSRVIDHWLVSTRGWHGLTPPRDPWRDENIINAIDSALDAIVQVFYLQRGGLPIDGTAYAQRRLDRTATVLGWLARQLGPSRISFDPTPGGSLGLAEIALISALDWMDFRESYPTARASELAPLRAAWHDHPSLAATRPRE